MSLNNYLDFPMFYLQPKLATLQMHVILTDIWLLPKHIPVITIPYNMYICSAMSYRVEEGASKTILC